LGRFFVGDRKYTFLSQQVRQYKNPSLLKGFAHTPKFLQPFTEQAVAKQILTKAKSDLYLAFLDFRNTPT
jgi:hypothetical protein